jgi:serine protease Do
MVTSVVAGGPAVRAGLEPGDLIMEFNGKAVSGRNTLVTIVMNTKPGSSVPIKVLRDKVEKSFSVTVEELNLDAEANRRTTSATDEEVGSGFGMTLSPLGTDVARQLEVPSGTRGVLISDVDPASTAARAGVGRGDVILRINRRPVETVAEASKALAAIRTGGTVQVLLWSQTTAGPQQRFVVITKE